MRAGADYFVTPAEPAQRRYEALRAYLACDEDRCRILNAAASPWG